MLFWIQKVGRRETVEQQKTFQTWFSLYIQMNTDSILGKLFDLLVKIKSKSRNVNRWIDFKNTFKLFHLWCTDIIIMMFSCCSRWQCCEHVEKFIWTRTTTCHIEISRQERMIITFLESLRQKESCYLCNSTRNVLLYCLWRWSKRRRHRA